MQRANSVGARTNERLRNGLQILGLAVAYFVTARLGLLLDAVAGFATLVWAPTGIAVAGLVLLGCRLWPAIAIGAFLANLTSGAPLAVALGIAAGNTLEAVLAAYALGLIPGFDSSLRRLRDVLGLLALAAFASTAVSATIGVSSLYFGGIIDASGFGETWRTWWLGDMVGCLIVAPPLLVWATRRLSRHRITRARVAEALALAASLTAVGLFVSYRPDAFGEAYLFFPPLIWAALRFGQRGIVTSLFYIAAISITETALGQGPFIRASRAESLFAMQAFLAVTAPAFLLLGAAISSIRDDERRRAAIMNAALDCFVTMDHKGNIVDFNPAAEETFGYRRQDVLGKEMAELLIPARLRDEHRAGVQRYLATRRGPLMSKRVDFPALRADGTEIVVELAIEVIETDGPPLFIGYLRDVTEQRLDETRRELITEAVSVFAESLDYERTLAAVCRLSVPRLADWAAVDVFDTGGQLRRVAGVHVDPSKTQQVIDLVSRYPPTLAAPHGLGRVLRTNAPELFSRAGNAILPTAGDAHLDAFGRLGACSYAIVPIRSDRLLGAITLAVTGQRRHLNESDLELAQRIASNAAIAIENSRLYAAQQEARRQAEQAVRVRDDFLSIASHELRNPLSILHLGVQRLMTVRQAAGMDATTDPIAQTVERMSRQVNRVVRLVDNLLDTSRITAGKLMLELEEVDMTSVVADVVARLEIERQRAQCAIELRAASPILGMWDHMRLDQIATNLISNALKYGAGKPIEISVDGAGNTARLVVRDHGVGIAPEDRGRIFGQFERVGETGQIRGFGLGLWIVKQIVDALSGTIEVTSEPGRGSTFTVELPWRRVEARPQPLAARHSQATAAGLAEPNSAEILIVEDEPDALDMLAHLLRAHGYAVAGASNGQQALEYVTTRVAPRMILLDLTMPVMDGATFLRRASAQLSNIAVVLISADPRLADTAKELDVAGFIAKPIDVGGLLATASRYCGQPLRPGV